jgi:hypothetical protein
MKTFDISIERNALSKIFGINLCIAAESPYMSAIRLLEARAALPLNEGAKSHCYLPQS